MAYQITGYIPDSLVWVELYDSTSAQEFTALMTELLQMLDSTQKPIPVVLDTSELQPTYLNRISTANLRQFLDHPMLDCVLVLAKNKVVRLMMTVAFNTARGFRLFDQHREVELWLKRYGISLA